MTRNLIYLLVVACCAALFASPAVQAASPALKVAGVTGPTHLPPATVDADGQGLLLVHVTNVGSANTSGTVKVHIGPFPQGVETAGTPTAVGWTCNPPGAGQTMLTCERALSVVTDPTVTVFQGGMAERIPVPIRIGQSAVSGSVVPLSVEGGGTIPSADGHDEFEVPLVISDEPAPAGIELVWAGAFDEDGNSYTQAGGHPHRAGALFRLNTRYTSTGLIAPSGDLRNVNIDLPPGFMGNPQLTPRCPQSMRARAVSFGMFLPPDTCPVDAKLGATEPLIQVYGGSSDAQAVQGLFNNEPLTGYPAQFSFFYITSPVSLVGSLRSDEDYGVTVASDNTPLLFKVYGAVGMLDGFPAGAGGKPFLTNPTGCSDEAQGTPVTNVRANTWQAPALFEELAAPVPKVTGCDQLEFGEDEVSFGFQPDVASPASPAGVTADLEIDQSGLVDPGGLATPHLKKSVVTLPEGLVLNPSAANGLAACSTAEIGLKGTDFAEPNPIRFDKSSPLCPDGSKVGTVEVETPLLEDELEGTVYLAQQGDNPFGSLIALYIVIDDAKTGINVKLPGRVEPDPQTGRLVATFDHNPQVPFSNLELRFRGGARGNLSTPDVCGSYSTAGVWTPWSAPDSGPPAQTVDSFAVSGGAGCPQSKAQRPFGLGFDAGATATKGGSFAPFVLRLTRPDGSQELDTVEVSTPPGFAASLKDVPYCSEAAIAQAIGRTARGTGALERAMPSCPGASRVGSTTVGAGTGPSPFYAGGDVYLAGPYKGAPLSMVFVVPAVAGPFDLGVQVVRTALHVDRSTAQVTAVSDEIPKILEGVPLQIQDVRVDIDRPGFTINPTSCAAKRIDSTVKGASGATAGLGSPFHATGCAALPFKPRLGLRLTGRRQVRTGRHPGIRAQVNQTGVGEAGIERAEVRLPKSLALDVDNAQALCEFEDGTKPDLEDHCPKGSIVGRARAVSPLLKRPLAGNVYFVKNVRRDPRTGNLIRTLPMIVAALRGEIAINLVGTSDTKRGKLVSIFDGVPDAPVSRFNLNIRGGRNGIIAVTRTRRALINLCARPKSHIAESDMDGHNGRRHDTDIRMKTPCSKRQVNKAKRAARKAARKAANARR